MTQYYMSNCSIVNTCGPYKNRDKIKTRHSINDQMSGYTNYICPLTNTS